MKNFCKLFCKYLFLFLIGGSLYYIIEILFRGYSHSSMFFVGGICFIGIGLINNLLDWDMPLPLQILIGDVYVLIVEFLSGCIFNLWLKLNVWDYSNLQFNFLGQICLPFALLWIPLVLIGIVLDDYIRYGFFGEEKPRYRFW